MNHELAIKLSAQVARELGYKLGTINEEPDSVAERVADGCTAEELAAAERELNQGLARTYTYSRALWHCLKDEANNAGDCGQPGMHAAAERIYAALNPRLFAPPKPRPDRPERAPGNIITRCWRNTSRYPDALVKQMITFILEGGRLPAECQITIEQSGQTFCSGRAWGASKSRNYARDSFRARSRATAKGGSVYVAANLPHGHVKVRGGSKGYLPIRVHGATEDFFAILAHEIRHVFQGYQPIYRECRKVRRYTFGTNAKLSEIDASLFEVRALRRFRREWPSPELKVLPLP